jgi:hypothetical protein
MSHRRRLERLERQVPDKGSEVFRVLIRCVVGPPNLATSKCFRTLGPNGVVTELIELDGGLDGLSYEDLDRFVATFPIEAGTR